MGAALVVHDFFFISNFLKNIFSSFIVHGAVLIHARDSLNKKKKMKEKQNPRIKETTLVFSFPSFECKENGKMRKRERRTNERKTSGICSRDW